MQKLLRPSVALLLIFTVLLGAVYPGTATLVARIFLEEQARGSLIEKDGKILGSKLIGQPFKDPKYFWPRPSSTPEGEYNAAHSAGSNLSPANPLLLDKINTRVAALKKADPNSKVRIPVDLVTASSSGLAPHITLAAANYQIPRVAKARKITEDKVRELVKRNTEYSALGVFGENRVNVLLLNLSLDGKL